MASDAPPPLRPGGLSLYANLLNPSASSAINSSTISKAPVIFKQPGSEDSQPQNDASAKKQLNADALRFAPTRRPQPNQKQKAKPLHSKGFAPPTVSSSSPDASARAKAPPAQPVLTSTLADWQGDDVNEFFNDERRQRGGRKKRKKNKGEEVIIQDWDDIYDASRPNNYEEYKNSEEKYRADRDWKDALYAHRLARRPTSVLSSDDDSAPRRVNPRFAPPSNYSFAPPPNINGPNEPVGTALADIPNDSRGEDAYAQRMRLGQVKVSVSPPAANPPSPPSPAPSFVPKTTISRAPVRYSLPEAPSDMPTTESEWHALIEQADAEDEAADSVQAEDAPRSTRPGQTGFAQRMMSKWGHKKGQGLGLHGTGITTALEMKAEKRKKRSDAEGGGFVTPAGMGRIVGGKKSKLEEEGKFGAMSEVVKLFGMVDGVDLDQEMGDLMQDIGDECTQKYGNGERIFIHRHTTAPSVPVFIKFTAPLSALRAVNALEGRNFNGNTISAKFFDTDQFEDGNYD